MLKKYLLKSKKLVIITVILTIFQMGIAASTIIVFQLFIDNATSLKDSEGISGNFLVYAIGLLLIYIFVSLIDLVRRKFFAKTINEIDINVKTDYFDHLTQLNLMEYNRNDSGYYLSRFNNDLPLLIHSYIRMFFTIVYRVSEVIFLISVALYLNWVIAIILLALSVVIIIFTTSFQKRFARIVKEGSELKAKYVSDLKSMISGLDEIKFNNAEDIYRDKYTALVKRTNKALFDHLNLTALYAPGTALLTNLLTYFTIVISCLLFINGYFTAGFLSASIYLSTRVFNPISDVFEITVQAFSHRELIEVVYSDFVKVNDDKYTPISQINSLKGKVSYKYDTSDSYILNDFSFDLNSNKKYLIVGESGKGKTTFLKILAGIVDYEGEVEIDKIELSTISPSSLYKYLSYVQQDSFILNDTIRNNIDLTSSHTDQEILEVIKKVQLDTLVNKKGLDTYISEELFAVSGGEKQRLALARSLIKKPHVILLDEVTSSLDKKTALEIEKTLISLKDTIVVYICHKATKDLIDNFDEVIDFDS